MKIKIKIEDAIECSLPAGHARFIKQCMSYKAEYWIKKKVGGKEMREYDKSLFSLEGKDHWYFYLGHLDRVLKFCTKNNIEVEVDYSNLEELEISPYHFENFLKTLSKEGIDFRKDQKDAHSSAIKERRGVIKAPTGIGKTILQLAVVASFPKYKALILAHTQAIVTQTVEEIKKFLPNLTVQQIGAGVKYEGAMYGEVIVATRQSFIKLSPAIYSDKFGIVIIDEGHHISSFEGTYAQILKNTLAPIRLAYTATPPTQTEAKLALEGLIGPIISTFSINEAVEKEILATPKIKLLKIDRDHKLRKVRTYPLVYEIGVVKNKNRNNKIVEIALKHKDEDKVCLIFVNMIEHGINLKEMFAKVGVKVPFVNGSMKTLERENIKKSMLKKRRKIAVATTAWKEGINIPSLNVVINGGGGKSEIPVLQNIGRGLRRTDDKKQVLIYDFFDPSHSYLISHFGERLTLYFDQGWL